MRWNTSLMCVSFCAWLQPQIDHAERTIDQARRLRDVSQRRGIFVARTNSPRPTALSVGHSAAAVGGEFSVYT
jgi:hypothetical protein